MSSLTPETPHHGAGRLEARHLQKSYGKRQVVKDVSLAVRTGEVVGLLGPNGAGKTTSFYMIVGLLRASAGDITIDGQSIEHMPIHRRARLGLGCAQGCAGRSGAGVREPRTGLACGG